MDDRSEAEEALIGLARELVSEVAGSRLLELALAARQDKPSADTGKPDIGSKVGGREVRSVFSHPDSKTALLDLGGGHFAEVADGQAGPVLHSEQFSHEAMLHKGWTVRVAAGKPEG